MGSFGRDGWQKGASGTGMEGREVRRGERKGNAERERGGRWQERQVKRAWLHVAATPTECSQIDQY